MKARFLQDNGGNGDLDDGLTTTEIVLAAGIFFLMVGVGASCKVPLVRKMLKSPKALKAALVGVCCQFVFMPIVAYLLTLAFGITGYSALGVALAGTMPGGSSSNVFAMWGHGVLELSVFMTIFSTIVAFGMTPLWLLFFTTVIDGVDPTEFAFKDTAITFALLVVPLSIGFGLNFLSCMQRVKFDKILSVLAVIIFGAVIVLLSIDYPNAFKLYTGWEIVVGAGVFFPLAAALSYGMMTALKFSPSVRRTVVIEVGMQNLALGFAIGQQNVKAAAERDQMLSFPLIYAMFMYFWGFVLIPPMRRQKTRNEEGGIEDTDPDFFVQSEDIEEKDSGETQASGESGDINV